MTTREALQSIYDRRGVLTPQTVVAEAQAARTNAGKYLRGFLEWDDAVAGPLYRELQAAKLIREQKVVYREATPTEKARYVRTWHSVRSPEGSAYEPVGEVLEDPFKRQLVLREMERDWRTLKRRWEHMQEFAQMVLKDIDAA
jgi:hypothetical protein